MAVHTSRPDGPAQRSGPAPTALLTAVSNDAEVNRAIAEGADLIDAAGLAADTAAAIRGRHPGVRWWPGSPAAVDADQLAAGPATLTAAAPLAAVVAAAAISTWLGAPVIRTRHVVPVRRAIDMTLSIAGDRLPALTTRGLA